MTIGSVGKCSNCFATHPFYEIKPMKKLVYSVSLNYFDIDILACFHVIKTFGIFFNDFT